MKSLTCSNTHASLLKEVIQSLRIIESDVMKSFHTWLPLKHLNFSWRFWESRKLSKLNEGSFSLITEKTNSWFILLSIPFAFPRNAVNWNNILYTENELFWIINRVFSHFSTYVELLQNENVSIFSGNSIFSN